MADLEHKVNEMSEGKKYILSNVLGEVPAVIGGSIGTKIGYDYYGLIGGTLGGMLLGTAAFYTTAFTHWYYTHKEKYKGFSGKAEFAKDMTARFVKDLIPSTIFYATNAATNYYLLTATMLSPLVTGAIATIVGAVIYNVFSYIFNKALIKKYERKPAAAH